MSAAFCSKCSNMFVRSGKETLCGKCYIKLAKSLGYNKSAAAMEQRIRRTEI